MNEFAFCPPPGVGASVARDACGRPVDLFPLIILRAYFPLGSGVNVIPSRAMSLPPLSISLFALPDLALYPPRLVRRLLSRISAYWLLLRAIYSL